MTSNVHQTADRMAGHTNQSDRSGKSAILVTGAAGFIGFHLAKRLLEQGYLVIGLDNFNSYYDVSLKESRWSRLTDKPDFIAVRGDVRDTALILSLLENHRPTYICHLAAQAGVRYSLENPQAYIDSNISGFLSVLEACRALPVNHLIFASSSSVYGANTKVPFAPTDPVDHPISLYAATKKSNELMAHTYASLFNIPVSGLRFFTVYGPWGRPDMALFSFLQKMQKKEPIDLYNAGDMKRDFTYIDDIVNAMIRLLPVVPGKSPDTPGDVKTPDQSFAPYRIYNIGRSQPEALMDVVAELEKASGYKALRNLKPMQPGDMKATCADVSSLERAIGYTPEVSLSDGIRLFVDWYKDYYRPV